MALQVISAGAAQGFVATLAKHEGIEIAGSFGAVGAMLLKFLAGEPCDVLILTHAQIADLAAERKVVAESCADLGTVATAVAVRSSDHAPDVSEEAKLRAALLAADAIYFPDPAKATAGIHFAKVIEQLGIREEVAGRLKTFPNGASAMNAMAQGGANAIGCTQETEILSTPGVQLVAPLPAGFQLETVYTAAVSEGATHREAAAAFVDQLSGEQYRRERAAAGFRGHSIRRARASDLESIREVVEGVLTEHALDIDPTGVDSDLADLDASYFARGGLFEVAVALDGRLVGCCGIVALEAGTCELRKMYLLREARGHGIGGRLLRRALAFARHRGYRRVELETASVLKDAIALYAGAGFMPIDRKHLANRCDQAYALNL